MFHTFRICYHLLLYIYISIYIYIHTVFDVFGLLSIFTTPWEWDGFSPHPCLSLSRFPGVANVATSPGSRTSVSWMIGWYIITIHKTACRKDHGISWPWLTIFVNHPDWLAGLILFINNKKPSNSELNMTGSWAVLGGIGRWRHSIFRSSSRSRTPDKKRNDLPSRKLTGRSL